jgi:hypothetical protein
MVAPVGGSVRLASTSITRFPLTKIHPALCGQCSMRMLPSHLCNCNSVTVCAAGDLPSEQRSAFCCIATGCYQRKCISCRLCGLPETILNELSFMSPMVWSNTAEHSQPCCQAQANQLVNNRQPVSISIPNAVLKSSQSIFFLLCGYLQPSKYPQPHVTMAVIAAVQCCCSPLQYRVHYPSAVLALHSHCSRHICGLPYCNLQVYLK